MTGISFQQIEVFFQLYGVLAVFLLGFGEEVLFVVPMSLLFVAAGFFVIDPTLSFFPALATALGFVGVPGAVGVLVGGGVVYGIFFWGGRHLIRRFGAYVGISWEHIDRLQRKFRSGHIDEAVLVLIRAIPFLPIGIVSALCGFVRLSPQEFIWTTVVGTGIRVTVLAMLGWYLGREYLKYAAKLTVFEPYIFIAFFIGVICVGLFLYVRYIRARV